MRSQLYPNAREKFLTGQMDWLAHDVRGVFLADGYTPNFGDTVLADIAKNSRIAVSSPAENRTATGGWASCSPIEFPLLFDNRLVSQMVLYFDTGDESTSELIFYIGRDDLVTEPFVPVGLDYYIYPNTVEGGLFRL